MRQNRAKQGKRIETRPQRVLIRLMCSYAESLSGMYSHLLSTVNENHTPWCVTRAVICSRKPQLIVLFFFSHTVNR